MRVYAPISNSHRISFAASAESEFEIQAELFVRLKAEGFHVRGEYNYSRKFRFDLIVFASNDPKARVLAIIETKRELKGNSQGLDKTMQGCNYRQFGVPVIQFYSMSDYAELVGVLKDRKESKEYSSKQKAIAQTEVVTPLAFFRLEGLLKRLTTASAAAFDAGQLMKEPLVKEIESKLDEFIVNLKKLKPLADNSINKSVERILVKGVHG